MFVLEDRVNRLGEKSPTGIIKDIKDDGTAVVLWGISDKVEHTEVIDLGKLQHSS